MVVFFLVVIVGLYARLTFPGLSLNGVAIRPDQLVPTYIVERFQVGVGLVVTLGLIAAGISTLEGLIQSLSVTFTQDLLVSNSPRLQALPEKRRVQLNRLIIGLLALITIALSTKQILAPDLSVAIFAQNGVYAFFSAAFFPLVMGMFTKKIHSRAAIVSTVTSLVVHFSVYYGNIGSYMQNPVNNPAIAATFAILSSVVAGLLVITLSGKKVATLESKTVVI
jgi:sodium/pantothenate symporter